MQSSRINNNKRSTQKNRYYQREQKHVHHQNNNRLVRYPCIKDEYSLKCEILKIIPTRKKAKMQFKVIVATGDCNGHIGVSICSSSDIASAIKRACDQSSKHMINVNIGTWMNGDSEKHTLPKITEGIKGDVKVRLHPAPKGTGIIANDVVTSMLKLAGYKDAFVSTIGCDIKISRLIHAVYQAIDSAKAIKRISINRRR